MVKQPFESVIKLETAIVVRTCLFELEVAHAKLVVKCNYTIVIFDNGRCHKFLSKRLTSCHLCNFLFNKSPENFSGQTKDTRKYISIMIIYTFACIRTFRN